MVMIGFATRHCAGTSANTINELGWGMVWSKNQRLGGSLRELYICMDMDQGLHPGRQLVVSAMISS